MRRPWIPPTLTAYPMPHPSAPQPGDRFRVDGQPDRLVIAKVELGLEDPPAWCVQADGGRWVVWLDDELGEPDVRFRGRPLR